MLTVEFEQQEGITVPYPPLFDDIRNNHGFVDLRGRPDLAANIFEGSQSRALRDLLVELAKPDSVFFTLGCDLGSHEEAENDQNSRYVAGGYVQLMHCDYVNRSPDDYFSLGETVSELLDGAARDHNWIVRFVLTFVSFSLDNFSNLTPSLWIWFYAAGNTAEAALMSREVILSRFREALTGKQLGHLLEEWRA